MYHFFIIHHKPDHSHYTRPGESPSLLLSHNWNELIAGFSSCSSLSNE